MSMNSHHQQISGVTEWIFAVKCFRFRYPISLLPCNGLSPFPVFSSFFLKKHFEPRWLNGSNRKNARIIALLWAVFDRSSRAGIVVSVLVDPAELLSWSHWYPSCLNGYSHTWQTRVPAALLFSDASSKWRASCKFQTERRDCTCMYASLVMIIYRCGGRVSVDGVGSWRVRERRRAT